MWRCLRIEVRLFSPPLKKQGASTQKGMLPVFYADDPEQYKSGTTFDEIYNLYSFDRELRNILLESLLKFESSIKSKSSYHFTAKYRESSAYLEMTNYSRDPVKLKTVLQVIATISNEISKKADKRGPIKHYLDNHDGVPFWVLIGYLTMGNMQYFYESLDESLRNTIAKDFGESFSREYIKSIQFTSDELQNILKAATFYRNVCAHEERLYNFVMHRPPRSSSSAGHLGVPTDIISKGNLFAMVAFLKLVIAKKDYKLLISKLKKLFASYETSFTSVNFSDIQNKMGFPHNCLNYL
ncbi:MAG: Abi family protein [Paenibacillus sp.]|uniref:Abi family protein n=1 Tax=Paenibacillus sp. TaxID=58172 RepID=UPI00290382A9|nr:Abi family protein [Paenibacillus sp.]MDU2241857.1 Abi family protein [Paenibacillus sp.]